MAFPRLRTFLENQSIKLPHRALFLTSGFCASHLFTRYYRTTHSLEGESMMPTLAAEGNQAILDKRYRHGRNIKLGDIVAVKNPLMAGLAGKRVIGLPGDYVLHDRDMAPTAGGARKPGWSGKWEREEPMMVQVPEGHVWLAGDNMARSRDSRFYGPVPLALIEAKYVYHGDGVFSWNSLSGEQTTLVDIPQQSHTTDIPKSAANVD
jgi:mitochondrial inner membrane protease subunit 1